MTTIGIYSPGEMGSIVGRVLRENGLRVVACVQGRSGRTRRLADEAQLELVPDYHTLVREADLILSIMVPAQAEAAAAFLAEHFSGRDLLYADCNAISPQTTRRIAGIIEGAGARFVDAAIIGPPPRKPGVTRFYASGEYAAELTRLRGLDIRIAGEEVGAASAVKMCYAALTKGVAALTTELLLGAEALGVRGVVTDEFRISQPERLQRMQRSARYVASKAGRYAGEMEEIAATFEAVGLTPLIHQGAADVYRFIAGTPLAERRPEDPDPPPSLEETLAVLLTYLERHS